MINIETLCKETNCMKQCQLYCVTHKMILWYEHSNVLHNECCTQALRNIDELNDKVEHIETLINQVLDYNKIHSLEHYITDFVFQINDFSTLLDSLKAEVHQAVENNKFTSFEDLHEKAK